MTIEEAIDKNVDVQAELARKGQLKKADAVQLGIEALNWYREQRAKRGATRTMWLPGETEK